MAERISRSESKWRLIITGILGKLPKNIKRLGKARVDELSKVMSKFHLEMKSRLRDEIDDTFRDQMRGIGVRYGSVDREAVEYLKRDYLMDRAISKTFRDMERKVREAIARGISASMTLDQMAEKVGKVVDASYPQLQMIVRNEVSHVRNMARARGWSKMEQRHGEKFKYKWIGPQDRRTTKRCHKIKQRTKDGVTMEKLMRIIESEADPQWYKPERPFGVHAGCRHTFVRIVE